MEDKDAVHPAIVLTGQHHARELITSSMALYPVLKMLHGQIHGIEKYQNMLFQNKYYVIPTINVDQLAYIESFVNKNDKEGYNAHTTHRKNMHQISNVKECKNFGVDLNRNYGFEFGSGLGN